jgi:hypothetical protein
VFSVVLESALIGESIAFLINTLRINFCPKIMLTSVRITETTEKYLPALTQTPTAIMTGKNPAKKIRRDTSSQEAPKPTQGYKT